MEIICPERCSVELNLYILDFGVNHLAYFTLMCALSPLFPVLAADESFRHSKKLYAWETGPVDDLAMLLLCGETDFKVTQSTCAFFHPIADRYQLLSDTAVIDRKIKFSISAKTHVALKYLREHLFDILSTQFRGQPLTETHVLWNELAANILGKIKPKDEREQTSITIVT